MLVRNRLLLEITYYSIFVKFTIKTLNILVNSVYEYSLESPILQSSCEHKVPVSSRVFKHNFLTTYPSNIWFAPWFSVQFLYKMRFKYGIHNKFSIFT